MSFSSLRRVLRSARKGLCATCSKTRYPQLEAAGAGHVGCLMYTLETIPTLIKDDHEVTAFHVAARKGQISILIYLIENDVVKSDEVFRARNGATPAHDAAGTGNLECLQYLLSRTKAGPNDLDNNSATLLHWATQSGHLRVVQWLVAEAQAPIDAVAKNGVTPFHLAAAKNHLDVLRWLVGFAFRNHQQPMKLVNAKDRNGSTPLYHAAHAGHMQVVQWLASKGGGDPTIANRQGLAPLHAATIAGHLQIVQYLFQFGLATAPGGLRTSEGACALHFAAAENHVEIMQWLLEQIECTGNERDHFQSTPLHDAAENGHINAIKVLCEHKADATLKDTEGNMPYHLAVKHGSTKCATYLDNYVKKTLLKRQINGSLSSNASSGYRRAQHSREGQVMDRQNLPYVRPITAFEEDMMEGSIESNAGEWETLHDLMGEDEIESIGHDQEDFSQHKLLSQAKHKRRLFEEKLAHEQEERQKAVVKENEMKEMQIRSQFIDIKSRLPNLDNLKPLEDTVKGHRELVSKLDQRGKKDHKTKPSKKDKSLSLPRSSSKSTTTEPTRRTKDDLDTETSPTKKGSVWITKLLGKRGTSAPTAISQSKSMDFMKNRRPSADPNDWNIPLPPSPPSVEYLMGKSRVAHLRTKPAMSLKEELEQTVWGRDAYDDEEEGTDSDDESDQLASKKPPNKLAKMKKRKVKHSTSAPFASNKVSLIDESGSTPKQKRQSKPFPSIEAVSVPKSDLPVQRIQQSTITKAATPVEVRPVVEEEKKPQLIAPIAKVASARSRASKPPPTVEQARSMIRQDTPTPNSFANQLNIALHSTKNQKPKAFQVGYGYSPPESPRANNEYPLGPPLSKQITPPQILHQLPAGGRPSLQRQTSIDDDSDDSFTSSEEETESSEEGSDDEEYGNRPIMARNMGVHGARIAKEVMRRMKNQRYPSIFCKPIITLDTLVEVRHEHIYEANTNEEMATMFYVTNTKRKFLVSWMMHVRQLCQARQKAEAMAVRRKRAILANVFYSWIQVKNEAEVEMEEKLLNAHKFYKQKIKRKIFQKWKTITEAGVKHEELEEQFLQWLNTQLAATGKPQVSDLFKSLADGVLIIMALANASGKKPPRHKPAPKIKIHKQDNWKVAYDFMEKIGISTKDFEPADLADLQEHAIYNMFHSIFRWKSYSNS